MKKLDPNGSQQQREALGVIARICEAKPIQQAWSIWDEKTSRQEIQLRLACIAHFHNVHACLDDLLFFFFRASDPTLYQAAARALGRHIHAETERWRWLQRYAAQHNVPLDEPVPLQGQRARRRVLMLSASHHARSAPPLPDLAYPVHLSTPASYLTRAPADVRVTLQAMHMLAAEHQGRATRWKQAAQVLVRGIAEGKGPFPDALLVRPWAALEATLFGEETPPQRLWGALIRQVAHMHKTDEPSFSDCSHRLRALDEVVHALASRLHTDVQAVHELFSDAPLSEETRAFAVTRYDVWKARCTGAPAPRSSWRVAARSMTAQSRWMLNEPRQRARDALVLLDASQYATSGESAALSQALDVLGVPQSPLVANQPSHTSYTGSVTEATIRLLVLLRNWERGGVDGILDARVIHEVASHGGLVDLVPPHLEEVDDEQIDIFADAFEHQLRLHIAKADAPRPAHQVYALAARVPHASLFAGIADLCQGREYVAKDGQSVPLEKLVRALSPGAGANQTLQEAAPPFYEMLKEVRHAAEKLQTAQTPAKAIAGWIALMRRQDQDGDASASIYAWVRRIYGPTIDTALRPLATKAVAQLQGQRSHLLIDALADAPAFQDAAQVVREEVETVCTALATYLSPSETTLLQDTRRHTEALLNQWGEACSALYEHSRSAAVSSPTELMAAVFRYEEGPLRHALVAAASRSIVHDSALRTSFGEREDDTAWHAGMLKQATKEEQSTWQRVLYEAWEARVQRAMAQGRESEVVALVQKHNAQSRPASPTEALSEEVEHWLLDRYHLVGAAQAQRLRNPDARWGTRLGRALLAYLGHFMHVWFALLVGALLMLDFGDAWFTMAEEGDQAGIAITFGLGVAATLGYLFADLRGKVSTGDVYDAKAWIWRTGRLLVFLAVSLLVATGYTSGFWYLLSGTEEVAQYGYEAVLSVLVWTSFALFVGVFLGLIAKSEA
ncbi:MAG: hypothetical protein PPP56_09875 [Longimonas sp.]|uniref:hypothetical protein n=1 Tax=Longimonas sp. TaxID=2039626 RepID=UPI0033641DC0